MIARNEIDTIETFFEQYCSYQSDIMFNYHTDRFFDNILSLGFVKDVVDTLMIKYPIDEKEFACRQCLEWFSFYKEIISQLFSRQTLSDLLLIILSIYIAQRTI